MYPVDGAGFALLQSFYEAHYASDRARDVHYGSLTARRIDPEHSVVTRDWYFSSIAAAFYRQWYARCHVDDLSFAVFDAHDRQLLTVPCTIFRNTSLCNYNQPVVLIPGPEHRAAIDPGLRAKLVRTALRHLDMLATEYLAHAFLVSADGPEWEEPIFAFAAPRPHFVTVRSQPTSDLNESNESLFASLRGRYRGYVNAGRRAYSHLTYSGEDLRSHRERVRNCALALSAPEHVLPEHELDHSLELCIRGQGEASLAFSADGRAVGVTLIVDDGHTAMYAVGAYAKDAAGPPISHWMLFDAMLRAKGRGMRWFFLSHIPGPRYDFDGLRLVDTGADRTGYKFFKLGFANRIRRWTSFRIWAEDAD
jgi:hypothetical protein